MKKRNTPDTPEAAYSRYLAAKSKFWFYLATLGVVIMFMVYLSIQGIHHELLRRSPDTETITASATSTEHTCDKSGCYYVSYGHYTINGQSEEGVKLGDFTYPTTGEVGIRVNPSQPRFAMALYQGSFIPQIVIPAVIGTFLFLWGILLWYLFWKRGERIKHDLGQD